jgi:hypothetical protein
VSSVVLVAWRVQQTVQLQPLRTVQGYQLNTEKCVQYHYKLPGMYWILFPLLNYLSVRRGLRRYATISKAAGSRPEELIEVFFSV